MAKKKDTWTAERQESARREGWELVDTIDNGGSTPRLRIYGCSGRTNRAALEHVLARAQQGSQLHILALRGHTQGSL